MFEEMFQLRNIFAPHERERREALIGNNRRLIHYTSAASAISILRTGQVWMRNVRCMNDYMEIEHGFQLLEKSLVPPVDTPIENGLSSVLHAVDEIFPALSRETLDLFGGWRSALRHNTYVACLSEHHQSENQYGRLSMWRAYTSNQVGVGIVINPLPLYSVTDTFGAFSSPVYYFSDAQFGQTLFQIAKGIRDSSDFLNTRDRDEIKGYLFSLLRSTAMCTKHPGFHEEQEWRIMHTQGFDEQGALSLDVETVNGIPQPVFKIPLKDQEDGGLTGISVPALVERVIIGPTQFPIAVYDAMVIALERAGIENARDKVVYSGIPLRT